MEVEHIAQMYPALLYTKTNLKYMFNPVKYLKATSVIINTGEKHDLSEDDLEEKCRRKLILCFNENVPLSS